jgi:hypothetical protein
MRCLLPVMILWCVAGIPGNTQSFSYNAGFDGFLDNREYYSIGNPKTIFAARTWGEVGADLNEYHRFRTGLNYLYEFGYDTDAHIPDVTMYYRYDAEKIDFLIGAFPRRDLLNFPLVFLSDTLMYYRPNVQGLYAAYAGKNWHQNVFIDWTSRQTNDRPERFAFGFSGNLRFGRLFLEDYFLMTHLAKKGIPDPDDRIRDNGGFNINLGLNLSDNLLLDTLVLKVGGLVSLDRIRGVDPGWQTPAGFLGQASARYRSIGIDALYYRGQGHSFFYGDPFYALNSYGRFDLYVMPFRTKNITLKICVSMHIAEGEIDYSQQILLSATVL